MAQRPHFDGNQAGVDDYRLAEEKRQADVAQQLSLNDQMRFWNGYPTSRGETIYYGYLSPGAAVAYGFWPWPYVPGDIWANNVWGSGAYYQPARQPIGQRQMQTGPNRWESHPVYDPPLTMYRPLPPVDSPLVEGTPYVPPQEAILLPDPIPPPPPAISPPPTEVAPPGPATSPTTPRRKPREY